MMFRPKTLKPMLPLVLGLGMLAFALAPSAPVAGQDDADSQAQIESAMAAGPSSVTENATIMGEDGETVLREGSNDWTCFPDAPGTPSPDPMCLDKTFMGWLQALVAGEEPNTSVVGLAYMLHGGSDASNTDPYASGPEEGNEWITSPAHVMLIMPGDIDQTVFSTDPLSGGPWIMWAGTPYEHIMMPVDAHGMTVMGAMDGMGGMTEATPAP